MVTLGLRPTSRASESPRTISVRKKIWEARSKTVSHGVWKKQKAEKEKSFTWEMLSVWARATTLHRGTLLMLSYYRFGKTAFATYRKNIVIVHVRILGFCRSRRCGKRPKGVRWSERERGGCRPRAGKRKTETPIGRLPEQISGAQHHAVTTGLL